MFEGRDVVVGQDFGEAVAAIGRQDRGQRVEFVGAQGREVFGNDRFVADKVGVDGVGGVG